MNTLRLAIIAALLSSAFATAAVADTQATAPSSRADAQAGGGVAQSAAYVGSSEN